MPAEIYCLPAYITEYNLILNRQGLVPVTQRVFTMHFILSDSYKDIGPSMAGTREFKNLFRTTMQRVQLNLAAELGKDFAFRLRLENAGLKTQSSTTTYSAPGFYLSHISGLFVIECSSISTIAGILRIQPIIPMPATSIR